MNHNLENAVVCIVGLGYVGLPLARAFAKELQVIGFDSNNETVEQLNNSESRSGYSINFTSNPNEINKADFFIICVPTPVTKTKDPDLSYIKSATGMIGQKMKEGSVVILESTVYPGVTEEVLKPILEKVSGLRCGNHFKIGYSPERINPGDEEHSIDKITKVVAGMDDETTELIANLYEKVVKKVFKARNIMTAEAAKVIENVQRDLNIALMNELSFIFNKMGLSTKDVMEAAATKWNFNRYLPGLVGGHCIPVDPYYLTYKAKELNYHPQIILAGRAVNDSMPKHVADITIKALNDAGKVLKGSRVLIMGLTYKENVADTRETPAKRIIKELKEYSTKIYGYDPYLLKADGRKKFDIEFIDSLDRLEGITFDAIIITVVHEAFNQLKLSDLARMQNTNPILIDVRGVYSGVEAKQAGFIYRTL
ncbi:nucleotide sugar dehydrogenase [Chloroflexota bacterium]